VNERAPGPVHASGELKRVRVLAGTSGYAYAPWRGTFYPEDLPSKEMLRYYATKLPAVEINNTFYRMPSKELLANWAAQVPGTFRFALKASQKITHIARLKPEAAPSVAYFLESAGTLGERLGPLLFQLPPNLKKDIARLSGFLALLPSKIRVAFEFRHESWFDEETFATLRSAGAALCVAEDEKLATPPVATAPWGYLRLRRQDYGEAELRSWAGKIREKPWEDVYVFFKHEEEGTGPALAAQFMEIVEGKETP
jgi:uncharacterized protein YecE (DUF72 family)